MRYAHAMRWTKPVDVALARMELRALLETAALRDTHPCGAQLYRCSKRLGRGLRVVVRDERVLWVGHGVPPASVWP